MIIKWNVVFRCNDLKLFVLVLCLLLFCFDWYNIFFIMFFVNDIMNLNILFVFCELCILVCLIFNSIKFFLVLLNIVGYLNIYLCNLFLVIILVDNWFVSCYFVSYLSLIFKIKMLCLCWILLILVIIILGKSLLKLLILI